MFEFICFGVDALGSTLDVIDTSERRQSLALMSSISHLSMSESSRRLVFSSVREALRRMDTSERKLLIAPLIMLSCEESEYKRNAEDALTHAHAHLSSLPHEFE